ncbi:MAG: hypothetical protein HY744_11375 [Deltaproteobacteria bacterium]|nr:hypothetical protein [Deltaproteobacteria bacterium]
MKPTRTRADWAAVTSCVLFGGSLALAIAACSGADDGESDSAYDKQSKCASAGGKCVAITPSACSKGEWGDADAYSCGGGLGVGCCFAASPPEPAPNACVAAGGECVGINPNACKDGIWGDANSYSCGGGLGVGCCLPLPEPPECDQIDTVDEGWYWPGGGSKICAASCAKAEAVCDAVGSKSEGWYSNKEGAGCAGGSLIAWDNCQ